MSESIVVRLNVTWALHKGDEPTCWGVPGDIVRLPMADAKPLIQQRAAVLVDQRTPLTKQR